MISRKFLLILALFAGITSILAQSTDSLNLPVKNLHNGIKYIERGKIAIAERDSLRAAIVVYEKSISKYEEIILNFEKTELHYKRLLEANQAIQALYTKQIQVLETVNRDLQQALKVQKRRTLRAYLVAGVITTGLLIIAK